MSVLRVLALGALLALALPGCATVADDTQDETAENDLLVDRTPAGIIHELSRLPVEDRPTDLTAVVHSHHLVLTQGGVDVRMALPESRFYLAVAPYIGQASECDHHDLTADRGPLPNAPLEIRVIEAGSGRVLVERSGVTAGNGFIGFWLPRDTVGTIEVSSSTLTGSMDFTTDDDDPTCLAGPQLAPVDMPQD